MGKKKPDDARSNAGKSIDLNRKQLSVNTVQTMKAMRFSPLIEWLDSAIEIDWFSS